METSFIIPSLGEDVKLKQQNKIVIELDLDIQQEVIMADIKKFERDTSS